MTDQTMIERVARALCNPAEDPDRLGGFHPMGTQLDDDEPWWKGYESAARRVLTAMREPTEGMLSDLPMHFDPPMGKQWSPASVWKRLIDVALAEG